jgi:hypothetical protein
MLSPMSEKVTSTYQLVSALFLRLLGGIYLIAFASIGVQIEGLIGSQGIHSAAERLANHALDSGLEIYFKVPTLFWLNASDAALTGAAIVGCIAALLIMLNYWSRTALITAFVLYLSLLHVSYPFLNFQWDSLLLETGFLAIFLTPNSRVVIWLFRWLLFRLRFMSGISKLSSGDLPWANFTALDTYFEVQPLPNPVAWYFHQLPDWLLRFGTGATLFVEILVPFMMFLPRRWRFTAAWLTIFFQLLIILTSNHNWINFLTIILCLFLFDDRAIQRVLPRSLQSSVHWQPPAATAAVRRYAVGMLGAFILFAGTLNIYELGSGQKIPGSVGTVLAYTSNYFVVNKYHVFPTMTTRRVELELLGSRDGVEWKAYRFKYKPDVVSERPTFIIPHQPRLDWQMWFVTLQPRHLPWFIHFTEALLDNSPTVTALLENNPFPDEPPRFIRVDAHQYHFTDFEEREKTGNWWKRTALGPFTPFPGIQREDGSETAD